MKKKSNMYALTKTWSAFKGCRFDCVYCKPSFQRQAKRQKHKCRRCYDFTPHNHPERLDKIPDSPFVFVCGNSDLSFCDPEFVTEIIKAIKIRNTKRFSQTYLFQSKRPECFAPFLSEFPKNVTLVTTLETNRDDGYDRISKAPVPSQRYRQFIELDYSRKAFCLEPLLDFDLDIFSQWVVDAHPEKVWMGFNSRPESVKLPEPSLEKVKELILKLKENNIVQNSKSLRGLETLL